MKERDGALFNNNDLDQDYCAILWSHTKTSKFFFSITNIYIFFFQDVLFIFLINREFFTKEKELKTKFKEFSTQQTNQLIMMIHISKC